MPAPSLFFSLYQSYGFAAGNYWSAMIEDICAALGRVDVPCDLVEASDHHAFLGFLGQAIPQPRPFIATFNFVVPFPGITIGEYDIVMQELFAARSVTIFLDHPVHLAPEISYFEQASKHHGFRPAPAPPPVYGVMDAEHIHLLSDLGIDPDRVFVFPQAGPPPVADLLPLADRPLDFLFHGTIAPLVTEDQFFRDNGLNDPADVQAARHCLAAALSGSDDVYLAAKAALGKAGDALAVADFARVINVRARLVRRWALLSALSDLNIQFCGEVCDQFRAANPNGTYHGPKNFTDIAQMMRQTKVVLNDTINLRHSALMRVHYAMAHGCVVASEGNPWFCSEYRDGGDIVLLDPDGNPAQRLRALLTDLDAAQTIADAGRAKQIAAHQWDHRVGAMVRAVG